MIAKLRILYFVLLMTIIVIAQPGQLTIVSTIDKSLIQNRNAITCLEHYIQRSRSGKLFELARGGFESPDLFNQWAKQHKAFQCISKCLVSDSTAPTGVGYVGSFELKFISKTNTGYALGRCFYEPNHDAPIQGAICLFKVRYFSNLEAVMTAYSIP